VPPLLRGFAAHSKPVSPIFWKSSVMQHQSVCAPARQLPGRRQHKLTHLKAKA
jgi:hypothetical protein